MTLRNLSYRATLAPLSAFFLALSISACGDDVAGSGSTSGTGGDVGTGGTSSTTGAGGVMGTGGAGGLACGGSINCTGDPLWSKRFGDVDEQWATATAVDASGNVLITGDHKGTVDFGGGPLTSANFDDVFVAKLDPAGNHLWSKNFGDADYQPVGGIAVDALGHVLLTGSFKGAMDFGNGPLVSAGSYDIFVAKLSP